MRLFVRGLGVCSTAILTTAIPLQGQQAHARAAEPACTVQQFSQEPLVVDDGRLVYVEADAFAVSQGAVFLAGTPNFVTQMDAGGKVTGVAQDSIFGAVIGAEGRSFIVPSPVDVRLLTGIRAVGRDGGGWDVVFGEWVPSGASFPDTVSRLWHGVFRDGAWTSLDTIPLPQEGALSGAFPSSLLRRGDTLWISTTLQTPSHPPNVALFQYQDGAWTHELIPTFHSQTELAHSPSLGLLLVVVQPDSTQMRDGNSMFIWAQQPEWRQIRRVVHGSVDGRVYNPRFTGGNRSVITWITPQEDSGHIWEHHAVVAPLEDASGPVVTVDSMATATSTSMYVEPSAAQGFWVTQHEFNRTEAEIRLLGASGSKAVVIARTPSPYLGWVAAAAPAPGKILVTGLHYVQNRYIVSVLIRADLSCPGGPLSGPAADSSTSHQEH